MSKAKPTPKGNAHKRARQAKNAAAYRARHPERAVEIRARCYAKTKAKREAAKAKQAAKPKPVRTLSLPPPPAGEITANATQSPAKWTPREPWIQTHLRELGRNTHSKKNLK